MITGAGGNFCSGGDVHEIIGPLTKMAMPELLEFTRMTGDLVQGDARTARSRSSPRSTASAPAPARWSRWPRTCASARRRPRRRFCSRASASPAATWAPARMLPRMIGQGRAAELLYTGRVDDRRRRAGVGLLQPARARGGARRGDAKLARSAADGPTFAHGMTKKHAAPGMGDELDAGASKRRPRRRRSACRPRISGAPYEAFVAKTKAACSRGIDEFAVRARRIARPPSCARWIVQVAATRQ